MKKRATILLTILMLLLPIVTIRAIPVDSQPDFLVNPYKAWSVAKALGMNDYQAAGFLGNMNQESGFDPTSIETIYGEEGIGPRKEKALKDLPSFARNEMVQAYINDGFGINSATDKHGNTIPQHSSNGRTDYVQMKYYIGTDGHFYPGIGLLGFTGPRVSNLVNWSKKYNLDWYTMETQLTYILVKEDSDGYVDGFADWITNTYIKTNHSTVYEATAQWLDEFEGGGTINLKERNAYAQIWYQRFKNDPGDQVYAQKILSLAKHPGAYTISDELDRSMVHDLSGRVLEMKPNEGFILEKDKTNKAKDIRDQIYKDLYNNTPTKERYSLYERFGEDIHFYRYFGEATVPTNLVDKIYTSTRSGSEIQLGKDLFEPSNVYLSANVYPNRPRVLTSSEVRSGKQDPRVTRLGIGRFDGYSYTVAEFNLGLAKNITSFTTLLMGPKPNKALKDFVDLICSTRFFQALSTAITMFFIPMAMFFFILSLVRAARKEVLGGQMSLRVILGRFGIGIISLGLIYTLLAQPLAMNNLIYKATSSIDTIFNHTIATSTYDDDIIGSSDSESASQALIWKTAIFNPWVRGQFASDYENLYTQFESTKEEFKMPQDHYPLDKVDKIQEGMHEYNSIEETGDVSVPLGNKKVRNWAAFLMSTQSPNHIDYEVLNSDNLPEEIPQSLTTAYNRDLKADTFRVLDAQMNIGPQVYKDGTKVYNYTNAHQIETDYFSQGYLARNYAIILAIFFIPMIIKRLKCLLLLLLTGVQIIFYSIYELFKESEGLALITRKFKDNFVGYFEAVIRIYILTITYGLLVGQGFLKTLLFIIMGIIIYNFSVKGAISKVQQATHTIKTISQQVRNQF